MDAAVPCSVLANKSGRIPHCALHAKESYDFFRVCISDGVVVERFVEVDDVSREGTILRDRANRWAGIAILALFPPTVVEGFRSSLHRASDFHRTRRAING